MIPTIWLINIWLAHHWFMDNWPGWKMVPKTSEEIAEDHAAHAAKIADVKWNPSLGWGLGAGALAGVALYFITIWVLPMIAEAVTIIK